MLITVIRDWAQGMFLTCGSPSVEDELMVEKMPVFIRLFICTFIKYSLSNNCELSPRKEQD